MCAIGLLSVTDYRLMADETQKPVENDFNESGDEIIDLEGLVRDIDLTPTGSIVGLEKGPLHAEALSHEQIDAILIEEDPALATDLEAIRSVVLDNESSGKALETEELANLKDKHGMSFWQRLAFQFLKIGSGLRRFKNLILRAAKDSKGVLREIGVRIKVSLVAWIHTRQAAAKKASAWFSSRNTEKKLALVVSIVAIVGLVFVVARTLRGDLLPKSEKAWVANFADHADGTFTYDVNGAFEDFNDPLLHPEFVVLVERIVVNLTRTPEARESANPMAAFELYLQTDTQDSAIEIKDRNVEIRDAIARSVERMTYPELAEEDGKTKLKLLIRKDLNELLTRGKVRRVFFKTIVLNSEE